MTTLKEQPNELQQKIYKLGYLDGKIRQFGKNAAWANARQGEPNKESHPTYWKGYDFGSDGNVEVDYRIFRKNWRAKNSTVYKPLEPTSMSHSEREKDYMAEKKSGKFIKKQLKQIIKEELSNVFSKTYKLGYLDGTKRNFGQNADWANKNQGEPNQESHPEYWKGYDDASGGRAEVDHRGAMETVAAERTKRGERDATNFSKKSKEAGRFAKSMAWPTEAKGNIGEKTMKYTKKQLKQIIKEEANIYLDNIVDKINVEVVKEGAEQQLMSQFMTAMGSVPVAKQASLIAKLLDVVQRYAAASGGQTVPSALPVAGVQEEGTLQGEPADDEFSKKREIELEFLNSLNTLLENEQLGEGIKDIVPLARKAIKVGGLALVMSLLSGVAAGNVQAGDIPGAGVSGRAGVEQVVGADQSAELWLLYRGVSAGHPQGKMLRQMMKDAAKSGNLKTLEDAENLVKKAPFARKVMARAQKYFERFKGKYLDDPSKKAEAGQLWKKEIADWGNQ